MPEGWWIRGARGAINIEEDKKEEIVKKGKYMINEIIKKNGIKESNIICIFFTVTGDLTSVSPGCIVREMGLKKIPVLCSQEPVYKNSLPRTIRVLILYYSGKETVKHVYMGEAKKLRPDLQEDSENADRF